MPSLTLLKTFNFGAGLGLTIGEYLPLTSFIIVVAKNMMKKLDFTKNNDADAFTNIHSNVNY